MTADRRLVESVLQDVFTKTLKNIVVTSALDQRKGSLRSKIFLKRGLTQSLRRLATSYKIKFRFT